jgi:hypothetical protein
MGSICGALAGGSAGWSQYRLLCDAAWSGMVSCHGAARHSGHFGDYAEVDAVKWTLSQQVGISKWNIKIIFLNN